MRAKIRLLTLIAVFTAPAGAAEQQYTQEQEDACGSILCLAGGGATPECNPYLKRFFSIKPKDRKGYLNKCPTSGVSRGAINELAAYGQNCESGKLANYLNLQICGPEQKGFGLPCRDPQPDDWQTLCGNFYAELTTDAPPKLVERCRDESDDTGALAHVCHHRWVENDYKAGDWCKDKDESCEETGVGGETQDSLAAK
jgi:hypothetical protein